MYLQHMWGGREVGKANRATFGLIWGKNLQDSMFQFCTFPVSLKLCQHGKRTKVLKNHSVAEPEGSRWAACFSFPVVINLPAHSDSPVPWPGGDISGLDRKPCPCGAGAWKHKRRPGTDPECPRPTARPGEEARDGLWVTRETRDTAGLGSTGGGTIPRVGRLGRG